MLQKLKKLNKLMQLAGVHRLPVVIDAANFPETYPKNSPMIVSDTQEVHALFVAGTYDLRWFVSNKGGDEIIEKGEGELTEEFVDKAYAMALEKYRQIVANEIMAEMVNGRLRKEGLI